MDKLIETLDGVFGLVDAWDVDNSCSIVKVYNADGIFVGDFKGSVSDYTDKELEDKIYECQGL